MASVTLTGAVVLLDALGASHFDLSMCHSFLQSRGKSFASFKTVAEEYRKFYERLPKSQRLEAKDYRAAINPLPVAFGDTLLLFFEGSNAGHVLFAATLYTELALTRFFFDGFMFRGAISFGEVVTDRKTTVIGPAVSQAAMHYEQPQLMAVVFVPEAWEALKNTKAISVQAEILAPKLVKANLPVKGENKYFEYVCVNWPTTLSHQISQPSVKTFNPFRTPDEFFKRQLDLIQRETNANGHHLTKYINTLGFYEYCLTAPTAQFIVHPDI